jgi:hypothetical protein
VVGRSVNRSIFRDRSVRSFFFLSNLKEINDAQFFCQRLFFFFFRFCVWVRPALCCYMPRPYTCRPACSRWTDVVAKAARSICRAVLIGHHTLSTWSLCKEVLLLVHSICTRIQRKKDDDKAAGIYRDSPCIITYIHRRPPVYRFAGSTHTRTSARRQRREAKLSFRFFLIGCWAK